MATTVDDPFERVLSPSTMVELKKHDDVLASICSTAAATATATTTVIRTSPSSASMDSIILETGPVEYHLSSSESSLGFSAIFPIERKEINRISHIGSGTYCKVDTVVANSLHRSKRDLSSSTKSLGLNQRYAYKSIDPSRINNQDDFFIATTELANEAKMLSSLDHQNIIKLRGVSAERFSESFSSIGTGEGYFLMIDLLAATLSDRLDEWRKQQKMDRKLKGLMGRTQISIKNFHQKLRSSNNNKYYNSPLCHSPLLQKRKNLHARIRETVKGIVNGMEYLHSKKIVLRDMKPANIGYESNRDCEDDVKLFDFGMAEKLEDLHKDEMAGSPRYMAPEVMAHAGYTLAVDVYSFGIILYEICSLKVPFRKSYQRVQQKKKAEDRLKFQDTVIQHGLKPYCNLEKEVCCPNFRAMIRACCDHDPSKRPSFASIKEELRTIFPPAITEEEKQEQQQQQQLQQNDRRRGLGRRNSIAIEIDTSAMEFPDTITPLAFNNSGSDYSADWQSCP